MNGTRDFLSTLFHAAVSAAHPAFCLPPHLPSPPEHGRLIVFAAGKAAGSMVEAAEHHYRDTLGLTPSRMTGLAVTRYGYGRPTHLIPVVEAAHPVPNEAGLAATERTIELAASAQAGDLVLALISGGASANWIAPAHGLTLADKQAVTQELLRSGASISEINTVRKYLSRIKGGRLAARAYPAKVVTLAISDVPRDDPSVIGSGPTVPDPSTLAEARAILARHDIKISAAVNLALSNPANETPKPDDPVFASTDFHIVARPADALRAAKDVAAAAGYACMILGDRIEGEASDVATAHARIALDLQCKGQRAVILSGGELTVRIRGQGRGGPNQEYALALAVALAGRSGISALAADTDGTDGGSGSADDPAGAFIDPTTIRRAAQLGLDPAAFLAQNDSTGFFSGLNDLVMSGPTFTNVNDFRAIVVDRP